MTVTERRVLVGLPANLANAPSGFDGRRRIGVVEQRRGPDEPFVPHQLLGVQPTVGATKHGMPLLGDSSELVIDRHESEELVAGWAGEWGQSRDSDPGL